MGLVTNRVHIIRKIAELLSPRRYFDADKVHINALTDKTASPLRRFRVK